MVKRLLLGLLFINLEVFAGFMGITKDDYVVAIKSVPLFSKADVKTKALTKLDYGTKLVEADCKGDVKLPDGWVCVKLKDDESKEGVILRNALISDSMFQNFLQGSSEAVDGTQKGVAQVTKKSPEASQKRKGKNFSDEEELDRSVKKGFAGTENADKPSLKTQGVDIEETLEKIALSDSKIEKFIKEGKLK